MVSSRKHENVVQTDNGHSAAPCAPIHTGTDRGVKMLLMPTSRRVGKRASGNTVRHHLDRTALRSLRTSQGSGQLSCGPLAPVQNLGTIPGPEHRARHGLSALLGVAPNRERQTSASESLLLWQTEWADRVTWPPRNAWRHGRQDRAGR